MAAAASKANQKGFKHMMSKIMGAGPTGSAGMDINDNTYADAGKP